MIAVAVAHSDRATPAVPGRAYPAWRDGRRITSKGPVLHAVTDTPSGETFHSGFLALCGRPVRYKVLDVLDPDDEQACLACALALVIANPGDQPNATP